MTSIKLGTQSIASIHRKFTKVLVSYCWQWWIQIDLQVRRSQGGGESASKIMFISPSGFSAERAWYHQSAKGWYPGVLAIWRKKHNGKKIIMVSDLPVYSRIATSVTFWIQKRANLCSVSLEPWRNREIGKCKQHIPFKPEWTDYLKTYSSIFEKWPHQEFLIFSLKW